MKSLIIGSALFVTTLAAGCVYVPANHSGYSHSAGGYSYASNARDCWREPVGARTYTPEITGAIVGGAIGNQFGRGSGRDVATVAGAVLGGSLGHDYKNRYYGGNYRVVCR